MQIRGICFSGARGSVAKGNEMRRACGKTRRAKSDGTPWAARQRQRQCVCVCVSLSLSSLSLFLFGILRPRSLPLVSLLGLMHWTSSFASLDLPLSTYTSLRLRLSYPAVPTTERRKERNPPPSLFLPSTNSVPRAGHPKQTHDSRLDNHSFRSTHF